jgi:hypothetical protein
MSDIYTKLYNLKEKKHTIFNKEYIKEFMKESKENKFIYTNLIKNPIIPKKSYPLNKEKIKDYLINTEESIRPILKKLFDNTKYISYRLFKFALYNNFRELIHYCKINNINTIKLFLADIGDADITDTKITRKSNFWVSQHFYRYLISKKVKIKLEIITNPDSLLIDNDNQLILILDDCSYSGSQLNEVLEYFPSQYNINVYIIIAYITKEAILNITKQIPKNINVILSKYNNIIKSFYEYLSPLEIKKIEKIKGLYDNKYPIYFNHKLADNISTYTDIYLGKIVNKDLVIPVITNCEHITELTFDSIWNPPCPKPPYKISSSDYSKYIDYIKTKSSSTKSTLSSLKQHRSYDNSKTKSILSSLKRPRSYDYINRKIKN